MLCRFFKPLLLVWSVVTIIPRILGNSLVVESLVITTKSGEHTFLVEIADTPQTRAQGLMWREHLAQHQGMLFVYDRAQFVAMWMKNTPLSLDMIFIDARGCVRNIERKAVPFSKNVIRSNGLITMVLEVPAGTADRIGLLLGDSIKRRKL